MASKSFRSAVATCIRRLVSLKGGPTLETAAEYVDAWVIVLEPLRRERYPLSADELTQAVNHFLQSGSPWFPTAGEFRAQIERNRARNWVTVSRVLDEGENGSAGRITFVKCPPNKVEEARLQLFSRQPDALPAPDRTATDQQIEKLRSIKELGIPHQANREVG